MPAENAPYGDDKQQDAETAGFVAGSTMNLISCLHEKSTALMFAAHETLEETDPLPRNLLAAFTRIERHVEMFLKVTNASLVRLHAPDQFLAAISLHRRECALKMVAIGQSLACPDGFLPPHVHDFSEEQCRSCLTTAAGIVKELAVSFQEIAEKYSSSRND
ncbi:MAG: hypothetical protein U0936_22150 [Planctomycetaceae bacterium]